MAVLKPEFSASTEWFSISVIAAVTAVAAWSYPRLPESVPSHWNAAGEVDGWISPISHSVMIPAILAGVYLLFLAIPRIEPRWVNFFKSLGFYYLIRNLIMAFFGLLYFVATWAAVSGDEVRINLIIPLAVGFLFVLIGNYMTQIRSNFFMGIRTRWTLSSDTVWQKTHRLGAYTFTIGGLLFFTTPWLPAPVNFYVPVTGILLAGIVPVVMSFVWFKQETANDSG